MATTTTVAASAVVASPSIALEIIPTATPSSTDAELVRLGAEFDAIRPELEASNDEVHELQQMIFDETVARRGNLGIDDAIMSARWDSSGCRAAERRNAALADRIESIYTKIKAISATGFAGVAVKMRVLRWLARIEYCDEDPDVDDEWFNEIDDEIRRLAGEDVSHSARAFVAPSLIDPVAECDPIFDVIENHRRAVFDVCAPEGEGRITDDKERRGAHTHMDDTAIELTNVRPTTIAGILALLTYVHHVNTGKVHFPGHPDRYSEEEFWPGDLTDDEVRNPRGRVLVLPFPYWIMENIRAAILELHAAA